MSYAFGKGIFADLLGRAGENNDVCGLKMWKYVRIAKLEM
jgi:hypothetical protein